MDKIKVAILAALITFDFPLGLAKENDKNYGSSLFKVRIFLI